MELRFLHRLRRNRDLNQCPGSGPGKIEAGNLATVEDCGDRVSSNTNCEGGGEDTEIKGVCQWNLGD